MSGVTPADLLLYAAAVAVPAFLVALAFAVRSHRSTALRERFGGEFDRTLTASGSLRRAIRDLEERERLAAELSLRPLPDERRALLAHRAASAQWRFPVTPGPALRLLADVALEGLGERGYPSDRDRELTLRLVSVAAPQAAVALRDALHEEPQEAGSLLETFEVLRTLLVEHVGLSWSAADVNTDDESVPATQPTESTTESTG